jgi:ubiquinone/menaquinone biosynthesis C-methylase UbiE
MSLDAAEQYRNSSNLSARQRIYRFARCSGSWHRWVFDHLRDLTGSAQILELGCGNAALWRENLDRIPGRWNVTLSDLSAGMLADARASLGDGSCDFRFARVDAQAIPFADQAFDAVVANHMLYHVPDRARAMDEIARVLKSGAPLVAATNGDRHMREVMGLIDRFAAHNSGITRPSILFTLEAGRDELLKHFHDVTVERRAGELAVTDPQAVVDYVLSIDRAGDSIDIAALRAAVDREIHRAGAFRVTTCTGLFIAR